MTRDELVEKINVQSGVRYDLCNSVVSALEQVILSAALCHETVTLSDELGEFFVQEHMVHLNKNSPRAMTKAKYTLMFRSSPKLKKLLKQSDEEFLKMLEELKVRHQAKLLKRKEE